MAQVKLNRKAIEHLLKVDAMPELARRGRAIAAAAGDEFEVEEYVGRNRARVTVRTATFRARYQEARYGTLSRAIDAGRG